MILAQPMAEKNFEGADFSKKDTEATPDPERVIATVEPVNELTRIVRSMDSFDAGERLDILSLLNKAKELAIQSPGADEPFEQVEQRLKYFASLAMEIPQLATRRPPAARKAMFDAACSELRRKISTWAGPYHWKKASRRNIS